MRRHNFKKLKVWELGMDVVDAVYNFAESLPSEERFGLRSQCTRAAVSIPSNLAEGSGKSSNKDFCRYVEIALGSSYEVETQLLICERRDYGDEGLREAALTILREEQKRLISFYNYLKRPDS
ncbi:MAG: four helix bundle protein [Bacteroidota bacterium]